MLRLISAALLAVATLSTTSHAQTEAEAVAAGEQAAAQGEAQAEAAADAAVEAEPEPEPEPEPELPKLDVAAFKLDTAQNLVDICALPEAHPDYITAHSFCIGYVTAAIHYQREVAAAPGMRTLVCPDRPIPRDELIQVFLDWSAARPDQAVGAAVVNVIKAASAKWPCPN